MTRAQKIHAEIAGMIEVRPATKNGAYKAGRNIKATGALNHSLGCAQPSADVVYNNMNNEGAGWGVTAILGDFHKGAGRIILALPIAPATRRNWGCGAGSKGSYNNSRVQWEVCEPSGHTYAGGTMIGYDVAKNAEYFARMWALLVKWNVYVAIELGYTANMICDHAESHRAGMGSNHADIGHWLPKHGKTMNDLRAEVAAILNDKEDEDEMTQEKFNELMEGYDPTYKTLEDVPTFWRAETEELVKAGAIKGDGVVSLGVTRSELKAAIINKRYTDARLKSER